jgi:hypothetical protein
MKTLYVMSNGELTSCEELGDPITCCNSYEEIEKHTNNNNVVVVTNPKIDTNKLKEKGYKVRVITHSPCDIRVWK